MKRVSNMGTFTDEVKGVWADIELVRGNAVCPAIPKKQHEDDPNDYVMWTGEFAESEMPPRNPRCECGAHAVGVDRHASYCPLFLLEER